MKRLLLAGLVLGFHWLQPCQADEAAIAKNLTTIQAVSTEGVGNTSAATAWKALVAEGPNALMPTLKAFQGANPVVRNWLRTAAQTIAENEIKPGRALPMGSLTGFVKDKTQDPAGRFAAYELIKSADAKAAEALLDVCLDDASVDIRRDAIAKALKVAKDEKTYRELFSNTRDKDQAEAVAKILDEQFKVKADLTAHFGYMTKWHVIGPFASEDGKGFAVAYPPESTVFNGLTEFEGKNNAKLKWKAVSTDVKYGSVNLNQELGKSMDSVAYAFARVNIATETPCEIRVGSKNAVQIYLNGKMLFAREAYHHGFSMDQHIGKGILKKGDNDIVLKVCQNNQKESWAQDWLFQLRVCDATGGKLPITPVNVQTEIKK